MPGPIRQRATSAIALVLMIWLARPVSAVSDPFIDEIVRFTPGAHAGFGQDQLPQIVLGPPVGFGALQGSTHTLSLGDGGSVVVRFDEPAICDGPGADFIVFENAFFAGSLEGPLFIEAGIVAVSDDGIHFVEFPYDAMTFAGLAGRTPVYSAPGNGIDPLDPTVAGGDAFDLADIGLTAIRFIRITDPGAAIPDPGNRVVPGNSGGFDLDAIAAIHTCTSGDATPTVTATATPSPTAVHTATVGFAATATATRTATATLEAAATATVTPTPTATAPASPTAISQLQSGDLDRNGTVDERDLEWLLASLFRSPAPSADVNRDGGITAADCIDVIRQAGRIVP